MRKITGETDSGGIAKLGIICMKGCEDMAKTVDFYLKQWRGDSVADDSYVISASCPRFGSGEAKGVIGESVRGYDIYILVDVFNYGVSYRMYQNEVPMSPDDHYQDLKRIIMAIGGKAKRINVIMPMLYEGRQHKRSFRESLDCAFALQELESMGVSNIITFDAHDSRVQSAIPLNGFDNVQPTYQMLKKLVREYPDVTLDPENTMIISPDEGGMSRCMYYSSVLGLDLGMFYKRRNYSKLVNGKNPIEAHEFLGKDVKGKTVIIVDDMISSGDSILDIAKRLKAMDAGNIFIFATFGLFCEGLERIDEIYEQKMFDKIFTTDLIYRTPELISREWYGEVNMGKYISLLINALNHDESLSILLNPVEKINNLLKIIS